MRTFLLIGFLTVITAANAQTFLPGGFIGNSFRGGFFDNSFRGGFRPMGGLKDSAVSKKWSLSRYSSISTSFVGWKGGYATVVAAPIGLQLNRSLNNNVTAFAGISVAPTYVNFRQRFMNTDINKLNQNNAFFKANNLSLYSRAEVGLSYTNDERTFQISGSIGVERNNYPMPVYVPVNNNRNTYNPPVIK
ncbi:MAG: hypothetical protein H0X70_10865 [Segetibacter sp.]|nr:hypothetical protein [Segetibacter sp.]